jgi:hypothetical protein
MRGGASIDEQNSRFIAGAIAAEFNLVRVEKQYSVYHQGTKGGFRVIDEATGKVSNDDTGTTTKQSWTEQRTEAAWEFASAMNPFDASVSDGELGSIFRQILDRYKKERECDKYLSNLFGDEGAYFFDDTFWKNDKILGSRPGDEHSHLYGSENDSSVSTNIYIPKGGNIVSPSTTIPGNKYLGSSRSTYKFEKKPIIEHNANYILVQYAQLGNLKNVTLAILHIDNFNPVKQKDGRTLIGKTGFTSDENYGSGGELTDKQTGKKGGHSHFELLKGLKYNLSFRNICP